MRVGSLTATGRNDYHSPCNVPVKAKLAMPIFLRWLFLKDLHHMFLYYEVQKGPMGTPEAFKQVLPDALSAEDWFRFHGQYANGEKIALSS